MSNHLDYQKCLQYVHSRNQVGKGVAYPAVFSIFLNWDSLHVRLNSHCKAWSYNKKKHKKIKAYMKFL